MPIATCTESAPVAASALLESEHCPQEVDLPERRPQDIREIELAVGTLPKPSLSSIEPNDAGDEVDGSQEVPRGLLVAGGDCTEPLDPSEEVLDQMARGIKLPVIVARRGPVGPRRDHRRFASRCQRLKDACIGVERLVGDQRVGLHRGQQVVGTLQVVRLTAGQQEVERVAQRVDQSVDLGAQSAA
jgi:hypothetical protein